MTVPFIPLKASIKLKCMGKRTKLKAKLKKNQPHNVKIGQKSTIKEKKMEFLKHDRITAVSQYFMEPLKQYF